MSFVGSTTTEHLVGAGTLQDLLQRGEGVVPSDCVLLQEAQVDIGRYEDLERVLIVPGRGTGVRVTPQ